MDIQEIQEKFEDLMLANPDFDESLLEKDEDGCYEDFNIQSMYQAFETGLEIGEKLQASKASVVPEYAEFYLSNGLFAICDWCDFNSVKSFKWNSTSLDSRVQWAWAHDVENGGEKRKKVAMHNVIMKPSEGFVVDHINGNGLDNRRSNLRIATRQQNTFNSVHKGGTSKYKGVALDKESGLWRAYIAKDGKRTWLGRFPDELSAAIAYDKAAKDMFGEYAKLNIATAQEPSND